MYENRLGYWCVRGGFPVIERPNAIVIVTMPSEPIEHKPEPPGEFTRRMLRLYRSKGYPLGKTRRGFKKWVKRKLLKAIGCKSLNAAKRKYRSKLK